LSADKVGLSHFVEGVFEHNYNFPYDFIMIDFNYFQDFISKKGLIKYFQQLTNNLVFYAKDENNNDPDGLCFGVCTECRRPVRIRP
jgi:hypothetical protein